jgi:hypothetical protein
LIKKAVRDTHYSSVEILQRREGEAIVIRLNRENEKGLTQRPRVVKIAALEKLRKEEQRTLEARQMLGSVCPNVVELLDARAIGGLVLEFACADNRDYTVRTLEECFHISHGRPPFNATTLSEFLQRLLRHALGSLYKDPVVQQRRLNHFYQMPTPDYA